eukprot:TRINITY_DN12979_c2_g1_i1.p1 TRINITY_DN12979_c2_g1~~TRINITY_DN12979_c2_g1_i1.p1  ORF type:complete len:498 (-),score=69.41 TRINITY_DN12979_c2_g1_i1:112-1605(-)
MVWQAEDDDAATVHALVHLLQMGGGSRPASAVGYIYSGVGGAYHRHVISSYGGVTNFVYAHSDLFAIEPKQSGQTCATIRLMTPQEMMAARLGFFAPCRFYQSGNCTKGAACKFLHSNNLQMLKQHGHAFSKERLDSLRSQVEYYLSDNNLKIDAFFHDLISKSQGGWILITTFLSCPRIQFAGATAKEIIAALRFSRKLQLREWPDGEEAVRRFVPPPPLEETATVDQTGPEACEPSLEEQPLQLLRDLQGDWEAVIDDSRRRSFCFVQRRHWSEDQLHQEFDLLLQKCDWQVLRSRQGAVTRSTAWYVTSPCSCAYTYGDASISPQPKPAWLRSIEERVLGQGCELPEDEWPNSVNMNLYEDEGQNVGWHSDDEGLFRGCEMDCRIISASWGASRMFELALKNKKHASGKPSVFLDSLKRIVLDSGNLCSMEGFFQRHYSHQLARGAGLTADSADPGPQLSEALPLSSQAFAAKRINLTWRYIVKHRSYCQLHRV